MQVKATPLFALLIAVFLIFSGCAKDQENLIVGTWERSFEDRLPKELPRTQWRFTSDYQLIRLDLPENNIITPSSVIGRWELTKRNRLAISKFDNGFNGEWVIVTLNKKYLKIILPFERDGKPAGQTMHEYFRAE